MFSMKLLESLDLLPHSEKISNLEALFNTEKCQYSSLKQRELLLHDSVLSRGIAINGVLVAFLQIIKTDKKRFIRFIESEFDESVLLGVASPNCLYISSVVFRRCSYGRIMLQSMESQLRNFKFSFSIIRKDINATFLIRYGFIKISEAYSREYNLYYQSGHQWIGKFLRG
jgi:hypothetical protein